MRGHGVILIELLATKSWALRGYLGLHGLAKGRLRQSKAVRCGRKTVDRCLASSLFLP